jgi:GT2 family glycosyltransferase
MKVTAIIPSLYKVDSEYLKLCVSSLRATVDWDIIVVTNGTKTNEPIPGLKGHTLRLHNGDQGQCRAVNVGAQAAAPDTDYLFVINSDMYFAPGWDKYLDFKYPVFSPNLVEPTNNPGSAKPFIKADGGFTLDEFQQGLVNHFIAEKVEEGQKPEPGFNLPFFIRKDVFDKIGGYDEAYDPWGSNSDTDLQTKINLAGITPMRLRDVLVYHFSNKSGTFDGTHQDYYQNNWEYFDGKWGFNRDQLGSDVWMNKKMLPEDPAQIKYKPDWMGKYGKV